jgi:hypothetical protein
MADSSYIWQGLLAGAGDPLTEALARKNRLRDLEAAVAREEELHQRQRGEAREDREEQRAWNELQIKNKETEFKTGKQAALKATEPKVSQNPMDWMGFPTAPSAGVSKPTRQEATQNLLGQDLSQGETQSAFDILDIMDKATNGEKLTAKEQADLDLRLSQIRATDALANQRNRPTPARATGGRATGGKVATPKEPTIYYNGHNWTAPSLRLKLNDIQDQIDQIGKSDLVTSEAALNKKTLRKDYDRYKKVFDDLMAQRGGQQAETPEPEEATGEESAEGMEFDESELEDTGETTIDGKKIYLTPDGQKVVAE